MKLLFIENRYKTFFYDKIADQLAKSGHEIHWLIQNKQFLPSGDFEKFVIEYPTEKSVHFEEDEAVEEVIRSDRQINHFGKKDTSYFYYYNSVIKKYLKNLNPDYVFGESTAFHELLTIANCKNQKIPYLNPSTCRYPIGRFSFYKYDSLEPYKGSNEELSIRDAEEVIDQIINRKTVPDYMKPSPVSKQRILEDKLKKLISYAKGEKYNTPSPIVKYKIEKKKKRNIEVWDDSAKKLIDNCSSYKILYPLQMQPEANIDVWGKKYRDQTNLIRRLADILPDNCLLYIKPNPKSKYELTNELISLVNNKANIISLHHSTKMDNVLPHMNLVLTVTGTIAIECILSNKPIATLVKTINNKAGNCEFISILENDLMSIINRIEKKYSPLTNQEKIDFINVLNRSSYKGIISDPFSDKNCMSPNNIADLVKAFESILKK
ncbi:hypothetical protein [Sediminicola sp. 1XM1-17]|uniref:hypothetical protein n=1 Tax=Sediminicola sp. 1XM1-17 TaxID=3127702 RepID=UPI0030781083